MFQEFSSRSSIVDSIAEFIRVKEGRVLLWFPQESGFSDYCSSNGWDVIYGYCPGGNYQKYASILLIGFDAQSWRRFSANFKREDFTGDFLLVGCNFEEPVAGLGVPMHAEDIFASSSLIEAILSLPKLGIQHDRRIRSYHHASVAYQAAELVKEARVADIAIIADENAILAQIEAFLLSESINLCYQKPIIDDGMVTFALKVMDSIIYGVELPFYSSCLDVQQLVDYIDAAKRQFDPKKFLSSMELLLGQRFKPDIRACLEQLADNDIIAYRQNFLKLTKKQCFFHRGLSLHPRYNCYVYGLLQAPYIHQSKAIIIDCDRYEGWVSSGKIFGELFKNIFYKCEVDVIHSLHAPMPYWLQNLELLIGADNIFRRSLLLGMHQPCLNDQVKVEAKFIPTHFSNTAAKWLLYKPELFYLSAVLRLECFLERSEESTFIQLLKQLFDQYCKSGGFEITEAMFTDFPYLRPLWISKIAALTEAYIHLHSERLKRGRIVRVESGIRLKFKLANRETWVKVCCDRLELDEDGRHVLIKYVFGEVTQIEQLQLGLGLEVATLESNGYELSAVTVWVVRADQIEVKDVALDSLTDAIERFDAGLESIEQHGCFAFSWEGAQLS